MMGAGVRFGVSVGQFAWRFTVKVTVRLAVQFTVQIRGELRGWSALIARLFAATRQPVRAICTRATRSGCR